MSTGLTQRSNSSDNKLRARPLQPSTNIIHTKIPKDIGPLGGKLQPSKSLDEASKDLSSQQCKPTLKGLSIRTNRSNIPQSSQPLKSATNTNHNKVNAKKAPSNVKGNKNKLENQSPVKKPALNSNTPLKTSIKIDENDTSAFVKGAYNPLDDYYSLDEELYQKVCKLELADDGLPSYIMDEAFDF